MIVKGVRIQRLNKPDKYNRVYTPEVVNKLISTYEGKKIQGKLETSTDDPTHQFSNLQINNNWLIGDIELFDTPSGKRLQNIVTETGVYFHIVTHCVLVCSNGLLYPTEIKQIIINAVPRKKQIQLE